MANLPRSFLTLNAIKTAHIIAGEGPPILFLHGWGAHSGLIWPLAERMINLGYTAYALDLPGFGHSDEPPQAWSVGDYAEFVVDYLEAHKLSKVYLFGHSFGGRLGIILGATCGKRIIKMALADSAGVITPTPLWKKMRLALYKSVREGLYNVGATRVADALRMWYGQKYGSTDYQNVSGLMRETFIKVVNQDLLPYARQIQVPTLLFWGSEDNDTPLWQGQLLEKTIPDAGLVIHVGAGHYSYLDKLPETARVMDYFFKQ